MAKAKKTNGFEKLKILGDTLSLDREAPRIKSLTQLSDLLRPIRASSSRTIRIR